MKELITQKIKTIGKILKNHCLACLLAILVGATSIAPHLLAQNSLGADYQGFPLLFQANEDYYMARIQDIIDGHWLASSPYLYEYKNDLSVIFPAGEFLYALPALLFGVSAVSILMATKFIFPALLFLLIYILLYDLSKRTRGDKITAALGGLLITVGTHFVNYKDTWLRLIGQNSEFYLSIWTRPVNPITGALFLFLFLILLWKSIRSDKWRYPITSGIVLGIMPGYIFSWMVALSITGAVVFVALIRRRLGIIKRMLLVVLGGILAGMPAWYLWFYSLYVTENSQYVASHNGLMLTYHPILNKVVLLQTVFFLALFLFEWRRKKKNGEKFEEWWWFAAALVVGNWIVFNQQIITGRTIWPAHLTQYTVPTAFLTFILVLGNYFKMRAPKLWGAVIAVTGGIIVLFIITSTFTYSSQLKEFSEFQRFMPFFNWLNRNAPKDCVVLVKEKENREFLSRWIPAFTRCNTYLTAYYPPSAPSERIYFNYVVDLRLRGVEKKDLEQHLWDKRVDLRAYFYTDWSQAFIQANADADDSWLAGPIQTLMDRYNTLSQEDFAVALKRYRIDYLASEEPLPMSLSQQLPSVHLLGRFGTVYVYQF